MEMKVQLTPYQMMNIQDTSNATPGLTKTPEGDYIPDGVAMIKAAELWKQGCKGQGVKIAIIDSGCQVDHPDLKDRIIGGRNFTTEDNGDINKYNDYNGHGTHVAGIVAASQNGSGIIGVAPEAKLLILKVMGKNGQGSYLNVVNAIKYATDQKVDIISMSLGGQGDAPELKQAIEQAIANEISVVCAASNDGDGNPLTLEYAYPAYYPEVISVGAEMSNRQVARFSDSNNEIDIIAPGVNIISTYIGSKYASLSGTSMAAPHVTGALALLINWGIRSFGRKLSEVELYAQLVRRAISIGLPTVQEGNGMVYLIAPDILQQLLRDNKI